MICKGENTIAAYIWAGFKASPSFGEAYANWTREAYGEVELCEKAVEYAPLLQELYEYMASKFSVWGVYEYETAEIFGGWLCESAARPSNPRRPLPSKQECERKIINLVYNFFEKEPEAKAALDTFLSQWKA